MSKKKKSKSNRKVGVLIGGSGLIGGTLAHYFKTKTPDEIEIRAPSSKKLSIRNAGDIRDYLKRVKPDFLINTAIANIGSDAQLALEVNYFGTLNLARAAAAMNIPYIHLSSAATLPMGENLSEDQQLEITPDLNNYSKSKLMAETTLHHMYKHEGLDYTGIRLAVVYGDHDHKIQGFHRMLFTIADESMPFLFTKKGVAHSYSNASKLPYFIHHILKNREEFSGEVFHFVDKNHVELSELILVIKSYLNLSLPREIFVPFSFAKVGQKSLSLLLKGLTKIGLHASLPAEIMFLESFYKTQTLSSEKLARSSYVDPRPAETIFTMLPNLVRYYLDRWTHQNILSTFSDEIVNPCRKDMPFFDNPKELLKSVHTDSIKPFVELLDLKEKKEEKM